MGLGGFGLERAFSRCRLVCFRIFFLVKGAGEDWSRVRGSFSLKSRFFVESSEVLRFSSWFGEGVGSRWKECLGGELTVFFVCSFYLVFLGLFSGFWLEFADLSWMSYIVYFVGFGKFFFFEIELR